MSLLKKLLELRTPDFVIDDINVYTIDGLVRAHIGEYTGEVPMCLAYLELKAIVINDKLAEMGVSTIMAACYHEVGHIKLGHIDENLLNMDVLADHDTYLLEEIEADEYAAKNGYADELNSLLYEIVDFVLEIGDARAADDLMQRIVSLSIYKDKNLFIKTTLN